MASHGTFAGKPFPALPRAVAIGDHAGDQAFAEPQDEGVAVLQDVAAVGRHAVGGGGFGRGADGKMEFGKAAHAAAPVFVAMRRGGKSRPQ